MYKPTIIKFLYKIHTVTLKSFPQNSDSASIKAIVQNSELFRTVTEINPYLLLIVVQFNSKELYMKSALYVRDYSIVFILYKLIVII